MTFWKRAATLQIASQRYSLDNLTFEFEVKFEDSPKLCTADVKVYNLSEATRNGIEKGTQIIINAGYQQDIGVIFVGQTATVNHERSGTDWITTIKAVSSLKEWMTTLVNKTYQRGCKAKDVVADLLNIFGVEVGEFDLKENKQYASGLVCRGKIKDLLQRIVVSDCKSRFLIKNNQVIINDPSKGIENGFLLTYSTGLLRTVADKNEQKIPTSLDTKKSQEQKDAESPSKKCECLLNYHFGVADKVVVQSMRINGTYRIVSGVHKGSRAGDWKSILELKA